MAIDPSQVASGPPSPNAYQRSQSLIMSLDRQIVDLEAQLKDPTLGPAERMDIRKEIGALKNQQFKAQQDLIDDERKVEAAKAKGATASGTGAGPAATAASRVDVANIQAAQREAAAQARADTALASAKQGQWVRWNPKTNQYDRYALGLEGNRVVPQLLEEGTVPNQNDMLAGPNGERYLISGSDASGNLKLQQVTPSQTTWSVGKNGEIYRMNAEGVMQATPKDSRMEQIGSNVYIVDPNETDSSKKYQLVGPAQGPEALGLVMSQTRAQNAAASASELETANTLKKQQLGEDVVQNKLTNAEALLKSGDISGAQKAFEQARAQWEQTAATRMKEKENALGLGQKKSSSAFLSQAGQGKTADEQRAAWAAQYASAPGHEGDSFSQRMARQLGYSDAIDYERGKAPTWDDFIKNRGAEVRQPLRPNWTVEGQVDMGSGSSRQVSPAGAPVPVTRAGANESGGMEDLGNGLFWDKNDGNMYAWDAKGLIPIYSGKNRGEAYQLAKAWFGNGPPEDYGVGGRGALAPSGQNPDGYGVGPGQRSLTGAPTDIEQIRMERGSPGGVVAGASAMSGPADRYTDDGMGRTRVGTVGSYPGYGPAASGGRPPVAEQLRTGAGAMGMAGATGNMYPGARPTPQGFGGGTYIRPSADQSGPARVWNPRTNQFETEGSTYIRPSADQSGPAQVFNPQTNQFEIEGSRYIRPSADQSGPAKVWNPQTNQFETEGNSYIRPSADQSGPARVWNPQTNQFETEGSTYIRPSADQSGPVMDYRRYTPPPSYPGTNGNFDPRGTIKPASEDWRTGLSNWWNKGGIGASEEWRKGINDWQNPRKNPGGIVP
jgi:hypothetical protein